MADLKVLDDADLEMLLETYHVLQQRARQAKETLTPDKGDDPARIT